MADDPDTGPAEVAGDPKTRDSRIAVTDVPHAPFIFYENIAAFGFTNGVVNLTLSANRTWVGPNGAVNEEVVVTYLRGNVNAALALRSAIDKALLLAAPRGEGKAN